MHIIDTHCHVLPCIDDGSKSAEDSLQMLHMMKKQGVDIAVATPHYYASENSINAFLDKRDKSFEQLKILLDENCPQIILGAETAFYFDISKDPDLEKLCIKGTKTLLLELPISSRWSDYEINEIQDIVFNRGLDVVIAHYERYKDVQRQNPLYDRVLDLPVYIQISSGEFTGFVKRKELIRLFESGSAHLLGSDAHNLTNRVPNLDKGRDAIISKLGKSKLDEIDTLTEKLFLADCKYEET